MGIRSIIGVAAAVSTCALAAPALGTVNSGAQNPHIVVTAQIGPNHVDVGERLTWSVTITNASARPRCIDAEGDYTAPDRGSGFSLTGCFGPGESFTFTRSPRARVGGVYTVRISAVDRSGVASTAHAKAVA
jgi:hypothetical protein